VRLTSDLQRSRERLVAAREEERRRLRHNLHDDLGPRLATLTLKLDATRNLLQTDPAAAEAMLTQLKGDVQTAIAEVRHLVYDLRPQALDQLGLVPALRQYAAQVSSGGLHVRVQAPAALPVLPAAVEVAAYRIATEALTNVIRHARAGVCLLSLGLETGALVVEVRDDGRGLAEGYQAGVGMTSMRERAEELGGVCVISPAPEGGVRVSASLPLRS
jgi:signal transduction histidine kinase